MEQLEHNAASSLSATSQGLLSSSGASTPMHLLSSTTTDDRADASSASADGLAEVPTNATDGGADRADGAVGLAGSSQSLMAQLSPADLQNFPAGKPWGPKPPTPNTNAQPAP